MNINLLPWRDLKRQQEKKQMITMLMTSIFLAILLLTVFHFLFSQQIYNQKQRLNYLKKEMSLLDQRIKKISTLQEKKRALQARMDIIQGLQTNRPIIVGIINDLVKVVPSDVYFTSLKFANSEIMIKGVAQKNNSISELMRNLDDSPWFSNPSLIAVKALENGQGNQFDLKVQQTKEGN